MFFLELSTEIMISVKDSLCGEECLLRMFELCLLFSELFMFFFNNYTSKYSIRKMKNKRDLRNFSCVIYAFFHA
jgi:hypothetical protein